MDKEYNVFYLSEGHSNVEICQYMSLNNFITHLQRHQYYVRRKNLFDDVNEKTLPIKILFKPTQAILDRELSSEEKDYLTKSVAEQSAKSIQYKELSNCFVSCWTLQTEQNNLMWDTYASKYGVCVKSSIFNVMASFQNKDFLKYEVYCAPVSYREPSYSDVPEDLLFVKRPLFKMESELRFLFLPKNKEIINKENIWLSYDPKVMIDEVILSPYWSSQTAIFIKASIEEKFNIDIK